VGDKHCNDVGVQTVHKLADYLMSLEAG